MSTNVPESTLATTTGTTAKRKENPYTKPFVGKCYRCGILDTSPINALKESKSIWKITEMTNRKDSRLKN